MRLVLNWKREENDDFQRGYYTTRDSKILDKAKSPMRRISKATGLISKQKMAELPKDKYFGMLGCLMDSSRWQIDRKLVCERYTITIKYNFYLHPVFIREVIL